MRWQSLVRTAAAAVVAVLLVAFLVDHLLSSKGEDYTSPAPGPSSPQPSWLPPGANAPRELTLRDHATYTVRLGQLIHFAELPSLTSTLIPDDLSALTYYGSERTFRPLKVGTTTMVVKSAKRFYRCKAAQQCGRPNPEWHLIIRVTPGSSTLPRVPAPVTASAPGQAVRLHVGQQLRLDYFPEVEGDQPCVTVVSRGNGAVVVGLFPGSVDLYESVGPDPGDLAPGPIITVVP